MADENTKSKKTISWNKQIKPLFKIIDALERGDEEAAMAVKRPEELEADIAAMGEAPMGEAPMDEAPMDENAEGVDLSPLEAIVGGPEAAARIWEASRQRDDLAAMTPQELADAIEEDFQLLMELEKLAAQAEGGGEEMPMEEMPPPDMGMGMGAPAGAPPMGPGGPGGMLPPGM